jgi:ribosome biogenesis GTPase
MKLSELGYTQQLEDFRVAQKLTDFELGRVITEHRERYIVKTAERELEAEVSGNLRFSAKSREDFPAVGDWVCLTTYDGDFSIIHHVLPRSSVLARQAVGRHGEVQLIATNIDFAFLVQALDRDFNINRLERYLSICNSAKVSPIIVLTKTDLIVEQQKTEQINNIQQRIKNIPILALSNLTNEGIETLRGYLQAGKTYCLLGSSGVGKSSLLNNLCGQSLMRTDAISSNTNKGRHITTHRELILLEGGALMIDNPGMREVGIADTANGVETTFDYIVKLAQHCKFADCSHTNELGCRVLEALQKGDIDQESFSNYQKIEREKAYFESSQAELRKKDKDFGKMLKNYKKSIGK